MLVLSRHRDESIIIGDDIVITVVDIRGDKVRLGIAAPIEISVHRQEVYEAIQRENRQASRLEPHDARQIDRLNPPPRREPPAALAAMTPEAISRSTRVDSLAGCFFNRRLSVQRATPLAPRQKPQLTGPRQLGAYRVGVVRFALRFSKSAP